MIRKSLTKPNFARADDGDCQEDDAGEPPCAAPEGLAADRLLGVIRALIEAAREQTTRAVNSAIVRLYWHIGARIRQDIRAEKRSGYGEAIVSARSTQLTAARRRG